MKTYNIFIRQEEKTEKLTDVILVKEGFNIFAALFNIFWFLYNKLWLFAMLAFFIINFALYVFSSYICGIFVILFLILLGFEANNLLLYRFQREKYYFIGYSIGRDEKDAKIKFLDEINAENKEKNRVIY
jgi:hypothetical protein